MHESDLRTLQPVVTAAQMAEIDTRAIAEVGLPGIVLMERAGQKVVEVAVARFGSLSQKRVVIFCGKGNNGGDGYVIARVLARLNACVTVVLLASPAELKGDAKTNYAILKNLNVTIMQLPQWEKKSASLQYDLVVDAVLGTGVKGPLKSKVRRAAEQIAAIKAPVLAVDLPTGMNADTGEIYQACVEADVTVTMGEIKRGLLFSPAREMAGRVYVADIGFPRSFRDSAGIQCFRLAGETVKQLLPQRSRNTFKNRCGNVLVVAGSVGLTGAAALTAEATLRSGCGMTTLGIPRSLNAILEQKLTEVMTLPLPETESQTLSFAAESLVVEKSGWADVVAIGPGLGVNDEVKQLLDAVLRKCRKPIVLDADGINCFAGRSTAFANAKCPLVLTPHPGEFARLTGENIQEVVRNPLACAAKAAREMKAVIVLKGAPTVVASPDGLSFVNSTGNPGMATAGAGDVLTGVIASFIAQGKSSLESALAGVYIHGLAGDLGAAEKGERGLIAGDLLSYLPAALKMVSADMRDDIEFV